jgi:Zn-dependent peptidase ImmA (M78 family)
MKTLSTISRFRKSIKIRGALWKIQTKFCLRDTDGTPCLGIADLEKKIIWIERDLVPEVFKEVLLHEYMHAIWHEAGLCDIDISEDVEHWVINAVAKDIVLNSSFWASVLR